MAFNSLDFAAFMVIVLGAFWFLRWLNFSGKFVLLLASYYFYMSWDWRYAGLLCISTVVDYLLGRVLDHEDRPWLRKVYLTASLCFNLGVLATFKYFNFFMETTASAFEMVGTSIPQTQFALLLPVGISFYTFQTMSYSIDVYRRKIPVEKNFLNFAIFVAFFPQLVAGPIVRAIDFLPQLNRSSQLTADRFHVALLLIFKGLFKKIVIADLLAVLLVDDVFARPKEFGVIDQWLALYGYAFQIYNDFSGYSDIAIGSAALLGFQLPENFNRPYLARGIREFWSRWHISLSTWLRDYLYIPLGGNRGTQFRTYFNLMVTMLLGGLWHGASMNFILWGLYHGLLLIAAHLWSTRKNTVQQEGPTPILRSLLSRLLCFHLVLIGWLLFRVESLADLQFFMTAQWSYTGVPSQASLLYLGLLLLAVLVHCLPRDWTNKTQERVASSWPAPMLGAVYATLLLIFMSASVDSPTFIYFQF